MLSDESRFSVTSDSDHQLRRGERGTRYEQKIVFENDPYGPGVMVWSSIMHNGRTSLHIFDRGSVSSQRYCKESILDQSQFTLAAIATCFPTASGYRLLLIFTPNFIPPPCHLSHHCNNQSEGFFSSHKDKLNQAHTSTHQIKYWELESSLLKCPRMGLEVKPQSFHPYFDELRQAADRRS
ncbi:hypothetical protein TNIN_260201 [Trichonephila inaurata madagascariensis]|uniref:Uncharacterized protein n=1 Tax=Trichonephila inaurata madagascariensis TaxID=2747483 RepID=A0A8X6YEV0_9ARAC|nr:hypothetical protein TNIN_260201 [Trichonephila inaurata madagascariensis]